MGSEMCIRDRIIGATLADLPQTLTDADMTGPALMFYGLAPRAAAAQPIAQILQEAL